MTSAIPHFKGRGTKPENERQSPKILSCVLNQKWITVGKSFQYSRLKVNTEILSVSKIEHVYEKSYFQAI